MSISYTKVKESDLLRKASTYGAKEFVHVKVNLKEEESNPFPKDYHFPPCFMPRKYSTIGERILNLNVRKDDISISAFPKSGTTWVMNIVSQLMNDIDLSTEFLNEKSPPLEQTAFLEINHHNIHDKIYQEIVKIAESQIDVRDKWNSPRLMKVHLPAHLMPKEIWTVKPKLIYVHRQPKDVACSMYHMWRNVFKYKGTINDFFDIFLNDHIVWGPYHEHIHSFQRIKDRDHILILSYEEILADTLSAIKKISEFLNYSYTDNQLESLTGHVSFQNMRNHTKTNEHGFNFFRKGKAGSYEDEMSSEYIRKFDEWENKMKFLTERVRSKI